MAEGFIVRRGGMGGEGIGGGSYIFFQTSQPPNTNGGLWVKTNLTRYEMNPSIIASGEFTGKTLEFKEPSISETETSYIYEIGGYLINNNLGYYLWERSYTSGSNNPDHYLMIQSMNLNTGICTLINRSVIRASTLNNNRHYESSSMAAYNGSILIPCWPNFCVIDSSGKSTQIETAVSYYHNNWCNIHESNVVPCWYKYQDSSSNKNDRRLCVVNITGKTISDTGNVTYPARCIGTDTDSKVSYAIQSNLASGESTYRVYSLNYSTNLMSMKKSINLNPISPQCYLNGLCYFFANGVLHAYNPSSDTYTNLGLQTGEAYAATSYSRDSSGINWVGSNIIIAFTLSGASGTGAGLRDDTVYIITGGTKNYATIVNGDNGSQQVPIAGVYTVVNGVLTRFDEAYVSTGGAWSKVTY